MADRRRAGADGTAVSLFDLYAQGRYGEVLSAGRAELQRRPRDPALLCLVAEASVATGDAAEAVMLYRRALAEKPDFAKGHNALGVALLRLRRFEEAYRAFRQALACDGAFAPAHFNVGLLLENAGRLTEAAEHYRRATETDSGHAAAHTALAGVLRELGDTDGVLRHLEAALSIRPDHVPAHRALMEFLEQGNRHEALATAVARAEAALGDAALVRSHRGMLAHIRGEPEEARRLLESAAVPVRDEATLHDEMRRLARLVRVCDELDDASAALQFARAANELAERRSRAMGVVKDTFVRFVEHRQRLVERRGEALRPPERASNPPPAPVFVVGFPRSGTTLLDTLLRGHPGLDVVEEGDAVAAMVTALAGPDDEHLDRLASLTGEDVERLRSVYWQALGKAGHGPLVVDRSALNLAYVAEIQRIFPGARFVLVLRDPADAVLSAYLQTFRESSASASFFRLADAAGLYHRLFTLWESCRFQLDPDVTVIRYETLVTDPAAALTPLLDRLGLPWHDGVLDHVATARRRDAIRTASYDQVIRPLYGDAVGRCQRYRDAMAPVMPVLAPWRARYGYAE